MSTNDPDQRREVFARFGLAAYHAQCVERELAILVATVANPDFDAIHAEGREHAFDDAFSNRIVDLTKHLRDAEVVDAHLASHIRWARRTRNWLHHNYFWDRAHSILTSHGREQMISELSDIAERLKQLDTRLTSLTYRWGESRGISQERIEAEVRATRE